MGCLKTGLEILDGGKSRIIGRVGYQMSLGQLRRSLRGGSSWLTRRRATPARSKPGSKLTLRLPGVASGDAAGFVATLDQVIRDTLTTDYWSITLPNELATSASKSPALLAYIAALNILDADILLSTSKVRSRLDPAITLRKGIERHHLFPRAYLKNALQITDTKRVNQIANSALADWSDNIAISDLSPTEYWPAQLAAKRLKGERLRQARRLRPRCASSSTRTSCPLEPSTRLADGSTYDDHRRACWVPGTTAPGTAFGHPVPEHLPGCHRDDHGPDGDGAGTRRRCQMFSLRVRARVLAGRTPGRVPWARRERW
jgi:hypothetical protein